MRFSLLLEPHLPNKAAKGRASNTARRAAILPPLTWYHSAMKAVPAGVLVTISYSTHTSSPSTNTFLRSMRWIMEASLRVASRYWSAVLNVSNGPWMVMCLSSFCNEYWYGHCKPGLPGLQCLKSYHSLPIVQIRRKYDRAAHSLSRRCACRHTPIDTPAQYPLLPRQNGCALGVPCVSESGCKLPYRHRGNVLADSGGGR